MSFDGLFDDLEARGTARFTLTGVKVRSDRDVVLIMKHAGHGNTAYLNARRKLDAQARARAGGMSGLEMLELLIPVFAKTVITGWEHVNEPGGGLTPATADNIVALLTALTKKAPDVVEQAFGYAMTAANFRDAPATSAEAVGNG